jgi:hypothetical protein
MDEMLNITVTDAKYGYDFDGNKNSIMAVINGKQMFIPLTSSSDALYAEIMRQVEAGELTIQEADTD